MVLVHYTAGVTGNLEVAREIVQEALMRFMQADDAKVAPHFEKAWLMRVCRNLAIDHLRRERRLTTVEDVEALAFSVPPEPAPGRRDEELESLQAALVTLSPGQQEVIRLRYQHDLSYKEISGITGRSITSVGVLMHGGLKRLKAALGKDRVAAGLRASHVDAQTESGSGEAPDGQEVV